MNEYVIITDSSCDIPVSKAQELGITVLPLEVNLEGIGTKMNDEINIKEFYEFLRSKKSAKTSAVNMDRFAECFDSFLKDGKDVLYIGFSSGLSATYMAAKNAAEELSEKYPERKVVAVDSLCASLGQGLLVYHAVCKKNAGADIEEVAKFVEDNKLNLCHWFTVDDLFFLKRGGRVSATTAVLGTMLSIKPVMHVDNEGHLINVDRARGRNAAITALFDKMRDTAIDPEKQVIYISHGDCYDDAKKLADMIEAEFGVKDIYISEVGPVIGAHSGPGTLALFFLGTQR
ncbi:MAG: DegV family protein [Ruminococcaceae bacterium]|nr:DegV family protein [Oscillospiraceae bacterium]